MQPLLALALLRLRQPYLVQRRRFVHKHSVLIVLGFDVPIATVLEDILANRIHYFIIGTVTVDRFKLVVEDHMILRTDETGPKMAYQSHQRRMLIGEAQELSLSCPTIELGDLLVTLELRVQNISWTAPNMSSK